MAMVQFRVDDELKNKAVSICEDLGIDLSTAIRMFMKRMVIENRIPFPMVNAQETYNKEKALDALQQIQNEFQASGQSVPTLEEINKDIKLARNV